MLHFSLVPDNIDLAVDTPYYASSVRDEIRTKCDETMHAVVKQEVDLGIS